MDPHMDKVALVTGSTNNIGRAIAERLAQDGFRVVVTSRHGDDARAVAAALPTPGLSYAVDFADAPGVER